MDQQTYTVSDIAPASPPPQRTAAIAPQTYSVDDIAPDQKAAQPVAAPVAAPPPQSRRMMTANAPPVPPAPIAPGLATAPKPLPTERTQPLGTPDYAALRRAASPGSANLMTPDAALAMATENAQAIAAHLSRTQMEASAPPVPAAPLSQQLLNRQQVDAQNADRRRRLSQPQPAQPGLMDSLSTVNKVKFAANAVDPFGVGSGLVDVAAGAKRVLAPGALRGNRLNSEDMQRRAAGAHQAIGGAFEAATPLMGEAAIAAPLKTAATLAVGMVSQAGVTKGLAKLGLPEEWANLAGDAAGVIAGIGAHAVTPKVVAAVKAKYEPLLRARAEKANAPAPVEYSSTSEPIRKPAASAPANASPKTYSASDIAPAKEPAQRGAAPVAVAASPVQPRVNLDAKLPPALRGAKPRYGYGAKQFTLDFESDLDRAAYITGQPKPSKADAAYLKFVMDATGATEDAVRQHGRNVRGAIKEQAHGAESGSTLTVADLARKRFAAKPAKPVAALVPPAVAPEALDRLSAAGKESEQWLRDNGYEPAQTIAAAPAHPIAGGADGSVETRPQVVTGRVRTPKGTKARFRWKLSEADNLKTSFEKDYNQAFQPRDTTRKGSRARVDERKGDMDFGAMSHSYMAGDGAPLTKNGMAVTRNHGLQALKELYREGKPLAGAYREGAIEDAHLAGKTPDEAAAMKHPVLHREMIDDWDDAGVSEFAKEANASSTARMSDAELAEQMASKLTGASMDAFHPNDDGVPNPEFVRGLIKDLPVEEQAMFYDKHGEISQTGARLVRNAVFAKAYPNRGAIERMSESTDSNVRNITNGMLRSANNVAKMQEAIERGDRYPLSIAGDIGDAAGVIDDLRSSRKSVADWLNQEHLEGRNPVLDTLVEIFSAEKSRPKVIAETIRNYTDGIDRAGNPQQESMFAAALPPTKIELLEQAYESAKRTADDESAGRKRKAAQSAFSGPRSGDAPQGEDPEGRGDSGGGRRAEPGHGGEAIPPTKPGVLVRLSAAGKESEKWLRDNGIAGGSSGGANRFLDPQVLFHLTRAVAGDVARGAISVGDAAQSVLDKIRDKFEGLPGLGRIGDLIRERIREAAEGRESGERGPVFREFRHDEAGATAALEKAQSGDAIAALRDKKFGYGDVDLVWNYPGDGPPEWERGSGLSHILAKHPYMRGHLQAMLDRMTSAKPQGQRVMMSNDQGEHATLALTWYGRENKTWLLTEYDKRPPATGNILFGSGNPVHGAGDPSSPPAGMSSVTATPEPRKPSGPVTLGSGLGAFEPFLRESYEDMKALKAKRDAAIAELERSKITPGEKRWGEQVRHFFTGERDLWGARANQGIVKARKLLGVAKDRRGVDTRAVVATIGREFKNKPGELKAFIDGYHPALLDIADLFQKKRVEERMAALKPEMEQAYRQVLSGTPDARGGATDQFYTNMASMTATEAKKVGILETQWNDETYVPHVLHPKGEGQFPGLRKAIGQTLGGSIGKYFGYSEHRAYPTLLHAIADDVIPKTLDIHDAFTVQQNNFARARATRLLEDQLIDTGAGKYTVRKNAPEGWEPLAPQSNEFRQSVPYQAGIDEEGQPVLDVAEKRLYVPKFIAEALKPITAPDFTGEIKGVHVVRVSQAATKAAQLGLSFFHATTENYMALANMGPAGWVKALRASRDSADFLVAERDLIAHGGTTSIQGNTVEAYRAMQPGSIPTYHEIWSQNAAVKIMDEAAHAISDFTFNNMQRRFKVTDYQLHTAAWMEKNPGAAAADLRVAKQGIAKEVNAIYGGLHWENIGLNKMTVEIARAVMLAPDWTLSNVFNVKYAFEKGPAGSMARMFWARTLVGGIVATQAASLMFSRGHYSKRPTMVYMGHDESGREIYQNIFFKGAPGDAANLVTNVMDYGLQGIVRTVAGKGAPVVRTGLQLINNRDYLGHEIAPKGMNPLASSARVTWAAGKSLLPIPLSLVNQIDMLFGPEAHKYTWPERLTTMFSGNPPAHVAPAGTHFSGGVLRPNAQREENSVIDQAETGQVYKRRAR